MHIRINHSSIFLSTLAALVASGCVGNDNSSKSSTGGSTSTAGGQSTGGKGTTTGTSTSGGSSGTSTSATAGGTAGNSTGTSNVGGTSSTVGGSSSTVGGATSTSVGGTSSTTGGASSVGGVTSTTAGGSSGTSTIATTGGTNATGGSTTGTVGGITSSGGTSAAVGGSTTGTTGGEPSVTTGGTTSAGGETSTTTTGPAGGAAPQGGSTAAGGTSTAGGTSSTGGSTSTCGANGQACCAAPADSCQTDLTCLLGASCSCAKGIFGSYIIRADGVVLQMPTTATGAQTPVLDANTAQPITGVVGGYDAHNTGGPAMGCALKGDGTVWCWRSAASGNQYGGLGNGNTDTNGATFRATQVLVSANTPLTNVKSLAPNAPCAITNDGMLYCWGALTWLVNNGTSLVSGYAQAITKDGATPLTGVQEISVGSVAQCALVAGATTNEAWCWGYNGYGNLGTGDTINCHYPTKILGLTNPTKIAVSMYSGGYSTNCAIVGGNVLCWGVNGSGEAGIGNTSSPVSVPTSVKMQDGSTPLLDITAVYAGNAQFCALRTGNTIWCWGKGLTNTADNIGLTNVVDMGTAWGNRTWLTSDGLYHLGSVTISPKCGSLQ